MTQHPSEGVTEDMKNRKPMIKWIDGDRFSSSYESQKKSFFYVVHFIDAAYSAQRSAAPVTPLPRPHDFIHLFNNSAVALF